MKKTLFIVFVIAILTVTLGCNKSLGKVSLKNAQDSLNYSLGLQIGKSFNATLTEVDYTMFVRGMKDSKDPDRIALTDEQIADIMNVYQQNAQARMLKKHEEDAKKNKEDQEKFFAKNIKNNGIIALNGIQYKFL
jgi:FKBP-type peptidyl-prolyl cis-trans isomerase